jgi:L-iditol 2-dehydrogenase
MGASDLTAINRSRGKLDIARRLGAEHVISTLDEDYYDQAMEITGGKGFDYIFECTGNEEIMKESFRLAANKGTICMIGTPKNSMSFTVSEWECINRKEFYLTGSWMSYSAPFPGEEWELTAYHFRKGDLVIDDAMIGDILPLSRIDEGFEMYKTPGRVKGKIL